MTWLDDMRAEALTDFRARFTPEAWGLLAHGQCSEVITYLGERKYCGRVRRIYKIYCDPHHRAKGADGVRYDALVVPATLRSMDLSEVK